MNRVGKSNGQCKFKIKERGKLKARLFYDTKLSGGMRMRQLFQLVAQCVTYQSEVIIAC